MSRFQLSSDAERDLLEIEDHIAVDNPMAARGVIDEFRAAMQLLPEMPYLGHGRSDVPDPRYRFYGVYSWLIVYNPATMPLQIIRIVHGHRDLPEILD